MDKKKTPLQEEKEQKVTEIIEKNTKPDGETSQEKPKKSKRGRPKKQVEPEPVFDPEQSMQQGMFFIEMMENIRRGMGIEKPIPDLTKTTFIQSIPAMEQKYGQVVSKYMPEMMFFGSAAMIMVDSIKELKIIRQAEKSEKKKDESKAK